MTKSSPSPENLPTEQSQTRLLGREEVEQVFGISKRFLELAAGQGGGPTFIKVGRRTFYRVSDLLAWIESNRFENTTQVAQRDRNTK